MRGNGERIGPQNLPTSSIAGGIWNLLNQQRAQQRGAWPSATPAVVTDPYFMYVPLLLNTTSTNAQQNNTFLDSSTNNFTITRTGTPTQGSLTPYQPTGYWSAYFSDGTNYATIPNSSNLDLSTGDFTVECWFNTPSLRSPNPLIYRFNGNSNSFTDLQFAIGLDNANIGATVYYGNAGNTVASVTGAVSVGVWYHCALVRTGNNFYFYFNGTRYGSLSSASTLSNGAWATYFGFWRGGNISYPAIVSLSNVRIVKGTALYTAATITVPTSPLTAIANTQFLGFQDNRFKDNSTNNFTITQTGSGVPSIQAFQPFSPAASYSAATYGGSGYFSGSASDYLSVGSAATDYFGSGDFTLEAWVYKTTTANGTVTGKWNATGFGWVLYTPSNAFSWVVAGGSSGMTGTIPIPLFAWTHVAVSRSGSNWALFVNGVRDKTASTSTAPFNNTTQVLQIGVFESGVSPFPGWISNLRIVKGTAVYDPTLTTLTVPTAPVTAITNTFLLTNFTNAGIYDAAWQNNALTVGDAQASISQYKWSPTSMRFDGTVDALTFPSSTSFGLGTGDWTIEFWLYLNATTAQTIVSMSSTTGVGVQPHIYYANGSGIRYYVSAADRITGGALSTGVWYYIAVVKSSNVTKMYINGTQTGSNYTDTNNYGATNPLFVGDYAIPLVGSLTLNGYIQDLRITKGVARTITTPTAAFPTR